jgi:hypothetical protein
LTYVVLGRTAQGREVVAALLGHGKVHGHEHGSGAVDGQRDGDLVEVDTVECLLHVEQRVDRHADPADLAGCHLVVRVETDLGRQVKGDVETDLAVGDQPLEALVGLARGTEAGVLAHGERPLAVHQGVDAAGERVLTGGTDLAPAAAGLDILGTVDRLDIDPGLEPGRPHPAFAARLAHDLLSCVSSMKAAMSSNEAPVGKTPS